LTGLWLQGVALSDQAVAELKQSLRDCSVYP
jgi:hypothetical protein